MRVECEGGAAAWLAGILSVPSVQGHGLPPPQSYGPIRVFIPASCSWRSEGLFGQSFSIAPPIQALRGLLSWDPSLWFSMSGTQRGSAGWDPTFYQCVRHLMGLPFYCSAANAECGEREAMVMAPLPMHDSAVSPCLHGCLAFLHRHFPP